MPHILLIDDDNELCDMLSEYLQTEGFTIDTAHDGEAGISLALAQDYDAIVLDVMLPKADGFSVLRHLRQHIQTPVLMLTAKGDDIDRIVGLEMGADDYLPKPCNPRELIARLRAILRRTQFMQHSTREGEKDAIFHAGALQVTPASRHVSLAGQTLTLTSTEYNLLEILIKHVGHVVSKETLSEEALGRKLSRYDRSIDMHLSKLRHKLGDQEQQIIQTVRGVGYQLCEV